MPLSIDKTIDIHTRALSIQARRAELLGANLANADTPGYKARDIDFRAAMAAAAEGAKGGPLAITQVGHIQPDGFSPEGEVLYRQPLQASLDGNTVETQVEMAEFAENAVRYLATLRFLSGKFNTYRTAFRGE